jgi:hypothetical protein
MVSGLTPPSKRDLDEKRDENIESLRDSVRFSAPTTNILNTMGSKVGGGGSQIVPAVQGLFATSPSERPEAIEITYTEATTITSPLKTGDQITTGANGWTGKLIQVTNTNVSDDVNRKEALFSNTSTVPFSNTSQTFSKSGWSATYVTNTQTENALVLSSSAPIVSCTLTRGSPSTTGNPIIKQIYGTSNNGQILFMKPKDTKTLTLATGGNIDISSNVTVNDDEFVILQYFEDVNAGAGKYLLLSGGGGSSTWVGTATSNLNMGAFYIEGSWGGTANLLGISSSLEMMNNNIIDVNQVQLTGTSGDVIHGYLSSSTGVLNIVSNDNGGDIDLYVKNSSGTQQKAVNIEGSSGTTTFSTLGTAKLILSSSLLSSSVPLAMSGQKITGLGTPTATTDAATKAYVDGSGGSTSFVGFQADANLDMNSKNIINIDDLKFKVTSGTSPKITVSSNSTVMNFDVNNINAMNLSEASGDPTLELIGNPSPELKTRSTDSSPSDGQYIGSVSFDGLNTSSQIKTFASLKVMTVDVSAGTEDGSFQFEMMKGGTATTTLKIYPELISPYPNDAINFGSDPTRFKKLYLSDNLYTKGTIFLDTNNTGTGIYANSSGVTFEIPSSDKFEFSINSNEIVQIENDGLELVSTSSKNRVIHGDSNTAGSKIGFHVGNSTNVGTYGTVEVPYVFVASYSTNLDGFFGNVNGSVGVQRNNDTGNTYFSVRSGGVWKSVYMV